MKVSTSGQKDLEGDEVRDERARSVRAALSGSRDMRPFECECTRGPKRSVRAKAPIARERGPATIHGKLGRGGDGVRD